LRAYAGGTCGGGKADFITIGSILVPMKVQLAPPAPLLLLSLA
jgi:hypothetical protein